MIVIFDENQALAPDPNRDPRIDPMPGDVLRKGEFTREIFDLSAPEWMMGYLLRKNGLPLAGRRAYCWPVRWRIWAQDATVIERGETQSYE